MVHCALEFYLQNKPVPREQEQNLVEAGKHITFTEQRAEDAERELTTVLTLQMLSKKIGEQLDCVVTGLTGFGVFVQCRKFGIEGLIRMAALGPDQWKYNEKTQCIVGERSGCSIRLGQAMKVRIVSVSVPARQLDVCPVELLVKEPRQRIKSKARKMQTKKKRKTRK
jgi:ribonuclease R